MSGVSTLLPELPSSPVYVAMPPSLSFPPLFFPTRYPHFPRTRASGPWSSVRPSGGQTALDGCSPNQSPLDGKRAHISSPSLYFEQASKILWFLIIARVECRWRLNRERGLPSLPYAPAHFVAFYWAHRPLETKGQSRGLLAKVE